MATLPVVQVHRDRLRRYGTMVLGEAVWGALARAGFDDTRRLATEAGSDTVDKELLLGLVTGQLDFDWAETAGNLELVIEEAVGLARLCHRVQAGASLDHAAALGQAERRRRDDLEGEVTRALHWSHTKLSATTTRSTST